MSGKHVRHTVKTVTCYADCESKFEIEAERQVRSSDAGRFRGRCGASARPGCSRESRHETRRTADNGYPEGFASILWKDASRSGEACEMMKLTAQDLYSDGIVEQVIPEPLGGAQRSHAALFEQLDAALRVHLKELCRMSGRQLADQRYKKYRQIGETRNA